MKALPGYAARDRVGELGRCNALDDAHLTELPCSGDAAGARWIRLVPDENGTVRAMLAPARGASRKAGYCDGHLEVLDRGGLLRAYVFWAVPLRTAAGREGAG